MKGKLAGLEELVKYFFVGVLTTVVGMGVFYGLIRFILDPSIAVELQAANSISWICAVAFAFVTNKRLVFNDNDGRIVKQIAKFVGARIITLFVENIILTIFVTWLEYDVMFVKFFLIPITTVLNYMFSKYVIFMGGKN